MFSYPLKDKIDYKSFLYLIIALTAILYGVAMEFVQKYFTIDREFDVNDMLADAVGAAGGYFFFRFIVWKLKQKNKPL